MPDKEPLTKERLASFLTGLGAWDVRVADPHTGFEHAEPERHPLYIFPNCRSVVVFIVPRPVWSNNTAISLVISTEDTTDPSRLSLSNRLFYTPGHRTIAICDLLRDRVWFAGSDLLRQYGFEVREGSIQEKLCCVEAGLSVYGRSGVTLHPELGNRFIPGVFLSDAEFEPDSRLADFAPCENCRACVLACPAYAYDPAKMYPENWNRSKCSVKRTELAAKGIYCHECFRVCPAGTLDDRDLLTTREVVSAANLSDQVSKKRNRDAQQPNRTRLR